MRVYAYIDGYNLYYRALVGLNAKWLNLRSLAEQLMPGDEIEHVKYFTARAQYVPWDPQVISRQAAYWEALRTLPSFEIVEGHFASYEESQFDALDYNRLMSMPPTNPGMRKPRYLQVVKASEKGSDVNLATHLVNDAHLGLFEAAMVISNDADLASAITIVGELLELPVFVYTPDRVKPCRILKRRATFFREINPSRIKASLFPDPVIGPDGPIHKPAAW